MNECHAAGDSSLCSHEALTPPSARLPQRCARQHAPLTGRPTGAACRVLYGQMHVSSYDWLHPAGEGGGGGVEEDRLPRPARTVLDRTFTNGDAPAVLFPRDGGNIHQFTALTDCAVLDLMSPPYSTGWCRACLRCCWATPPLLDIAGGACSCMLQLPPATWLACLPPTSLAARQHPHPKALCLLHLPT